MSDQDLQLLEQVRLRLGLATIDQTVETLARSALYSGHQPDCDRQHGQTTLVGQGQS